MNPYWPFRKKNLELMDLSLVQIMLELVSGCPRELKKVALLDLEKKFRTNSW